MYKDEAAMSFSIFMVTSSGPDIIICMFLTFGYNEKNYCNL